MVTASSRSSFTVPSINITIRSLSPSNLTSSRSSASKLNLFTRKKKKKKNVNAVVKKKLAQKTELQYRKLGDSDLNISEITLGTMPFGEQNTEKEAHDILSYAFEQGINILDTSEVKETQGRTDLYIASWLKSQPRDKARPLCCIVWRVLLPSKWRSNVPFVEQLKAFKEVINEGKVCCIGVSNETSYGVMELFMLLKVMDYQKLSASETVDLVEVCHPNCCNIGLLAYSPLAGGALRGKYLDMDSEAARKGRLNLFPQYTERYNQSIAREATVKYLEAAKKHGLTPVKLALAFVRDRPFVASSIIGSASVDQMKEDIGAVLSVERPWPPEVMADIECVFKRYKDPSIL